MSKRAEIPGPGIERAGAYRTADGKLHATRDEARVRNAEIGVRAFVDEELGPPGVNESLREALAWTICERAAELLPLLKELLRKPASKPTEPTE